MGADAVDCDDTSQAVSASRISPWRRVLESYFIDDAGSVFWALERGS